MNKFTCKCSGCKAKFEIIAEKEERIICPACSSQKNTVVEKTEVKNTGCDDCSGCSSCH